MNLIVQVEIVELLIIDLIIVHILFAFCVDPYGALVCIKTSIECQEFYQYLTNMGLLEVGTRLTLQESDDKKEKGITAHTSSIGVIKVLDFEKLFEHQQKRLNYWVLSNESLD